MQRHIQPEARNLLGILFYWHHTPRGTTDNKIRSAESRSAERMHSSCFGSASVVPRREIWEVRRKQLIEKLHLRDSATGLHTRRANKLTLVSTIWQPFEIPGTPPSGSRFERIRSKICYLSPVLYIFETSTKGGPPPEYAEPYESEWTVPSLGEDTR
jgi:hypothetical protein